MTSIRRQEAEDRMEKPSAVSYQLSEDRETGVRRLLSFWKPIADG
jgi:hypothetical protein